MQKAAAKAGGEEVNFFVLATVLYLPLRHLLIPKSTILIGPSPREVKGKSKQKTLMS